MNYRQLIKDFNKGILDKSTTTVIVDNDDIFIHVNTGDEYWDERASKELTKIYGRGEGYRDIVDILKASGVNAEWC